MAVPDNGAQGLSDAETEATSIIPAWQPPQAASARDTLALHTVPEEPGVTLTQFRALVLIDSEGAMRSADLAEALAVSPSTATRLCDRLVDTRHDLGERGIVDA